MLFVESTEGGRIVYSVFDLSQDPPVEYRDRMDERPFKDLFSWNGTNDKWTWHDKKPFPWERVIDAGGRPACRTRPRRRAPTYARSNPAALRAAGL